MRGSLSGTNLCSSTSGFMKLRSLSLPSLLTPFLLTLVLASAGAETVQIPLGTRSVTFQKRRR